ncbi:MAG: ClbS/DfsB family four-helix bundle protein [Campylobacteraceae bacterium]
MPRALRKDELIKSSHEAFDKLWILVESMSSEEKTASFLFEDRDKNLRDVFIHLYEWHQLLLKWVKANKNGDKKPFLPEPYSWKTYPKMNIEFWEKHQNTPHKDSVKMLKNSHEDVMSLAKSFSNDELFTKKYFSWTGSTSLGSYFVSATSSHYEWAIKKIKKQIKELKKFKGEKQ